MIVRTPTEYTWLQPDYDQVNKFDVIIRDAATGDQINGARMSKPPL